MRNFLVVYEETPSHWEKARDRQCGEDLWYFTRWDVGELSLRTHSKTFDKIFFMFNPPLDKTDERWLYITPNVRTLDDIVIIGSGVLI